MIECKSARVQDVRHMRIGSNNMKNDDNIADDKCVLKRQNNVASTNRTET